MHSDCAAKPKLKLSLAPSERPFWWLRIASGAEPSLNLTTSLKEILGFKSAKSFEYKDAKDAAEKMNLIATAVRNANSTASVELEVLISSVEALQVQRVGKIF